MQLTKTESWAIACDFPEELQLFAYIGQREGFRVGNDAPSRSSAEAEWRGRWASLPTHTFGVRFESMTKENPNIPVLQRIDPRESGYSPPDFASLSSTPSLQKLCQTYWPVFYREWGKVGGQKTQMIAKLQAQLRIVRLDKLVRACVWRARKFSSRPFRFRVDFVVWPEDYQTQVTRSHLILGMQYLELAQVDRLRALLKEYITKLV